MSFKNINEQAEIYLGLRLRNEERGKQLAPAFFAAGLLSFDGSSWSLTNDVDARLLKLAPELLNRARLREMHLAGDRGAWGLLCDSVGNELEAAGRANERHLIPELNFTSPIRTERTPAREAALVALRKPAPAVRDDAYWKGLEKSLQTAILGEEH